MDVRRAMLVAGSKHHLRTRRWNVADLRHFA
jgi:hypothetical protein